jgi:hypothetical protein
MGVRNLIIMKKNYLARKRKAPLNEAKGSAELAYESSWGPWLKLSCPYCPTASNPREEDITLLLKFSVHRFGYIGGADRN